MASHGATAATAAAREPSSYGGRPRERRPDGPPAAWSRRVVWARDSPRGELHPAHLPAREDLVDLTGSDDGDDGEKNCEDGGAGVDVGEDERVWIKWQSTGAVVRRPRSLVQTELPRRSRRQIRSAAGHRGNGRFPVKLVSGGNPDSKHGSKHRGRKGGKAALVTPTKTKGAGTSKDHRKGSEASPTSSTNFASEHYPREFINSRVAKIFDGAVYFGTVTGYIPSDGDGGEDWWRISYDDGDGEDMDPEELKDAVALCEREGESAPSPRKRRRRGGRGVEKFSWNLKAAVWRRGGAKATKDPGEEHGERKGSLECIMCVAHGRKPDSSLDDPAQFLPVRLKPNVTQKGKVTVAWVHACCALRAPPSLLCKEGSVLLWSCAKRSPGVGGEGSSPSRDERTGSNDVRGCGGLFSPSIGSSSAVKGGCASTKAGSATASGTGGWTSSPVSKGGGASTKVGFAAVTDVGSSEVRVASRSSLDTGVKSGSISPIGEGTGVIRAPQWWDEVAEKTHGHPGLKPSRFDSTSPVFVPYAMSFSDWVDELALYDFRRLLASSRRFDEGLPPPYNAVGGGAALWRGDDRGSIAYCRMAPDLVRRARGEGLSPAEAALWGAVAYRCLNRLSTFSRWAAAQAVAAEGKATLSAVLRPSGGTSAYERACHGPLRSRREEFHALAASGVTLYGRCGIRDKWGKDCCLEAMEGDRVPGCCVAAIPLPSEIGDFAAFVKWEGARGRSVMTGEHQSQPRDCVLSMLQRLAAGDCKRLRMMTALIQDAENARTVLDELRTLDMVGYFFAWQIFSDLVAIQYHCQLFPVDAILPSSVVRDSLFDFALFGPGARKGASIIDGAAAAVLEHDRDASQERTLKRARRILAEFPVALKRAGLGALWDARARGRRYDLETLEHSLCDFYGALANHSVRVVQEDHRTRDAMARAAGERDCAWPPAALRGPSHSAGTRERQGGPAWRPNPSTALEWRDLKRMINVAGYCRDNGAMSIERG